MEWDMDVMDGQSPTGLEGHQSDDDQNVRQAAQLLSSGNPAAAIECLNGKALNLDGHLLMAEALGPRLVRVAQENPWNTMKQQNLLQVLMFQMFQNKLLWLLAMAGHYCSWKIQMPMESWHLLEIWPRRMGIRLPLTSLIACWKTQNKLNKQILPLRKQHGQLLLKLM